MAVYFLDTSALVKRYVAETGSGWVRTLTDPAAGHSCWIAEITAVELVAALYRRARAASLTLLQAQQFEQIFRRELATHYQEIGIVPSLIDQAMRFVGLYPLRAYDAVQLAAALHLQARQIPLGLPLPVFLSADQDLSRAALGEGLGVDDPNLHP